MTKFHINKHGVPAPCKAKNDNCPLGGDEAHFSNPEQAQEYIDNKLEKEFGLLGESFINSSEIKRRLFESKVEDNKANLVETLVSRGLTMDPETVDYSAEYMAHEQEKNPNFKAGQMIELIKKDNPDLIW